MAKEETKKVEKQQNKFEFVNIPTQTSRMIREVGTEGALDIEAAILRLLNDVSELKRQLI